MRPPVVMIGVSRCSQQYLYITWKTLENTEKHRKLPLGDILELPSKLPWKDLDKIIGNT